MTGESRVHQTIVRSGGYDFRFLRCRCILLSQTFRIKSTTAIKADIIDARAAQIVSTFKDITSQIMETHEVHPFGKRCLDNIVA